MNKDLRLFVNTMKEAVDMIRQYGLDPEYIQTEDEDTLQIVVRIQKAK